MHKKYAGKLAVNHIALFVSDLDKSVQFYSEIMQFEHIPDPFQDGWHSWFQIGEACQLHLIEGKKEAAQNNINNHLAYTVTDFDEFVDVLVSAEIPYGDPFGNLNVVHVRPDGIKQIFFKDPDGYWLEVNNDINS